MTGEVSSLANASLKADLSVSDFSLWRDINCWRGVSGSHKDCFRATGGGAKRSGSTGARQRCRGAVRSWERFLLRSRQEQREPLNCYNLLYQGLCLVLSQLLPLAPLPVADPGRSHQAFLVRESFNNPSKSVVILETVGIVHEHKVTLLQVLHWELPLLARYKTWENLQVPSFPPGLVDSRYIC